MTDNSSKGKFKILNLIHRMKSLLKIHLTFILILWTLASCQTPSTTESQNIEDNTEEVATSESTPQTLEPLILVDPIGERGLVTSLPLTISGRIVANTTITQLTFKLDDKNETNILSNLNQDHEFELTLSDLERGIHSLAITAKDNFNVVTQVDLQINYSPDNTPSDPESPNETSSLWFLILDILNTSQNRFDQFGALLHIFKDNEQALYSFIDFFDSWDGSTESLQSFWDEWASPHNLAVPALFQNKIANPSLSRPNVWTLSNMAVSLNNIEKIKDALLPQLLNSQSTQTNNSSFVALKNKKKVLGCDFEWTIEITKTETTLNFSENHLKNIEFLDDQSLSLAFDLRDAKIKTHFALKGTPSQKCVFKASERTGTIESTGLSGDITFKLNYDTHNKIISVADILSSNIQTDSLKTTLNTSSKFWSSALEWLFKRLYGCLSCSNEEAEQKLFAYLFDLDDALFENIFNQTLKNDPHVENLLITESNRLLKTNLAVDGDMAINEPPLNLHFSTFMEKFTTHFDPNRLISYWTLTVEDQEKRDPCAQSFLIENPSPVSEMPVLGDVGVQLSFYNLANMLRGLARTGAFCFEDDLKSDDLKIAHLTLKPFGTLRFLKSELSDAHIDILYPFQIGINWGSQNTDQHTLNPVVSNNKIYGELLLSIRFDSDCESGLNLSIINSELNSLQGHIKINQFTFDVSTLEPPLQEWVHNLSWNKLQNIPITRSLIDSSELSPLHLRLNENVVVTDTDINFGLDLDTTSSCQ